MASAMDNSDLGRPLRGDHYREIAGEVRDLIPLVQHPKARKQLRKLVVKYERLADALKKEASGLRLIRRQAG
jgi:hypothetical protein